MDDRDDARPAASVRAGAAGPEGVTYVDAARLSALLPPAEALRAIQDFFATHGPERVAVPQRIHLPVPGQDNVGLYMPAATSQYIGVKLAHLMPSRRPNVEAEIFLYDAETGRLLFWGDGKPLTGLRTAATSTAASLQLKPKCRRLTVFGAGLQAAAHIAAFAAAYPMLESVQVASRSPEAYQRLRERLDPGLRERVQPAPDRREALAVADCVVTTTPAPEPLFDWNDLAPDAHVVGIGSATPAMNELPPQAFLESEVWLDTANAIKESGDLHRALEAGWKESRLAGDLFALLGAAPPIPGGRRTLFKSVGHAAQDLALLIRLWERLR